MKIRSGLIVVSMMLFFSCDISNNRQVSEDGNQFSAVWDSSLDAVRLNWEPFARSNPSGYDVSRMSLNDSDVRRFTHPENSMIDSLKDWFYRFNYYGPYKPFKMKYTLYRGSGDAVIRVVDIPEPSWAKRMDTVRLRLTGDLDGNVELRWNAVRHPDLRGWRIVRKKNGIENCSDTISNSVWSDSVCESKPWEILVDSSIGSDNPRSLFAEGEDSVVYQLWTVRHWGKSENLDSVVTSNTRCSLMEWRDSQINLNVGWRLHSVSRNWLALSNGSTWEKISKNGQEWESVPESLTMITAGMDSVWLAQRMGADSIKIRYRLSVGEWGESDHGLPGGCDYLWLNTGNDSRLRFVCLDSKLRYGLHFYHPSVGDSFDAAPKGMNDPGVDQFIGYSAVSLPDGGFFEIFVNSTEDYPVFRKNGELLWKRHFRFYNGYARIIGSAGPEGGFFFRYRPQISQNDSWGLYDPVKGMRLINIPVGLTNEDLNYAFVFRDEIWVPSGNHVHKGALSACAREVTDFSRRPVN